MSNCEFEKYFDEYIRGELETEYDIEFQTHLAKCKTCPDRLEEFYQLSHLLSSYKRPKASKELLHAYHRGLRTGLLINAPFRKISSIIKKLVFTRSPWIRLAEATAILVIGIIIGTLFLTSGQEKQPIPIIKEEFFAKPVSKVDRDYMNYYFSASEIVLLELLNSEANEGEFLMSKEVSQKLLVKTFLVHEIALRLNEPQILRFLGQMELILMELSNVNENELDDTVTAMKMVIENANLLDQVQDLQKILKNPGSLGDLPG